MIAAVFFPANPDTSSFDLQSIAIQAYQAGLQVYTNGRQLALLPRPVPGWTLIEDNRNAA